MYQLSYIAVVMQHKKHREPHTYVHILCACTSHFNYQTIPESCQYYGGKTGTYITPLREISFPNLLS